MREPQCLICTAKLTYKPHLFAQHFGSLFLYSRLFCLVFFFFMTKSNFLIKPMIRNSLGWIRLVVVFYAMTSISLITMYNFFLLPNILQFGQSLNRNNKFLLFLHRPIADSPHNKAHAFISILEDELHAWEVETCLSATSRIGCCLKNFDSFVFYEGSWLVYHQKFQTKCWSVRGSRVCTVKCLEGTQSHYT